MAGLDHGRRLAKMRAAMHIGSVYDEWPMYSADAEEYTIGDIIGIGASSVVHQGVFKPLQKSCAIKIIDLESYGRDTEELRRETQLMSLSKHPNVLRVRGCWIKGSKLHIATRLMSSGSMLDILRFSHPDGFDELVIATVLRQALQGLHYLHVNGWLHRDLKAANILVDDDGTVLLGDFGVGVFLGETGNSLPNQGKRKSFVGTPCWMAPEVIQRKHYGTKADIWSFGITALELAHGKAPNATLSPVKVLMRTMQEEPPTLNRSGGAHTYSKLMDDFVRLCLQKDPDKRPEAEGLLSHAFLRQCKPPKYLVGKILDMLPPLATRQERSRRISSNTLQHCLSWDFDMTHSSEDSPMQNTTNTLGSAGGPSSQWTESVKAVKPVLGDRQHVSSTSVEESTLACRYGSSSYDLSPKKAFPNSHRNRMNDEQRLRKSVSFGEFTTEIPHGPKDIASLLAPIDEKVALTPNATALQNDTTGSAPAQSTTEASRVDVAAPLKVPPPLRAASMRPAAQNKSLAQQPKAKVSLQHDAGICKKRESVLGKLFSRK